MEHLVVVEFAEIKNLEMEEMQKRIDELKMLCIINSSHNYSIDTTVKKSNKAKKELEKFELYTGLIFLVGIAISFVGLYFNIGFLMAVGSFLNLYVALSFVTTGLRLVGDEFEEEWNNIDKLGTNN